MTVTPSSRLFDANNVVGCDRRQRDWFRIWQLCLGWHGKDGHLLSRPKRLFSGREISVGQVARMSYWTKTGATHAVNPADWFMAIYTKPFVGDVSTPTWYGSRFGAEPYYSANIIDPANTWNLWQTNLAPNTLRFFESTQGATRANFGSYTDPGWADFIAASSLGTTVRRAMQKVLFFSLQTGSAWADGFIGKLDGLRIELVDGSVATVNFEPNPDTQAPVVSNVVGCAESSAVHDGELLTDRHGSRQHCGDIGVLHHRRWQPGRLHRCSRCFGVAERIDWRACSRRVRHLRHRKGRALQTPATPSAPCWRCTIPRQDS
jgi:hypothetical protein